MRLAIIEDNLPERDNLNELFISRKILPVMFSSAYRLMSNADFKFDVVVTDHHINGITGIEVAMAVKRVNKHCTVIVYTGFADATLREQYRLSGVQIVIEKPRVNDLLLEVEKAIMQHSKSRVNKLYKLAGLLIKKYIFNS